MTAAIAPLAGYTIGVTGHRRWEEQAEMLSRRGAQVVHGPVMRTNLLEDAGVTLEATEQALAGPVDIVVLTTGIGTRSWFGVAESAGLDDRLRAACGGTDDGDDGDDGDRAGGPIVLARGPKARSAAIANGLEVDWHAPGETSAEVVARLAEVGVAGKRVVVQRDGGEPVLADAVAALGAEVVDVPVYRWQLPDDEAPAVRLLDAAVAGRLHALTFTCAYAVGSAFALAPDPEGLRAALSPGSTTTAVAVGPVTAAALRAHGVDRVVEPGRARLGAMVQALVAVLSADHRVLRFGVHQARWQGDLVVQDGAARDATTATLTAGEARVLGELVRRAPAVVPKAELVDPGADPHAAEAAVARLRSKLGPLAAGIRSVPRRGYACTLEVAAASP